MLKKTGGLGGEGGAVFHEADWSGSLPWMVVGGLFLFLVVWFWELGPGLSKDDYALYLLHAEALVEGRGYAETGFIHTPLDIAPPVQPPGLPVLLAAVALFFGGLEGAAVKIAMCLLSLMAVLVPGLYFARRRGSIVGATVSAFLAVAWAPSFAHPETDLGFVGLVWATLFLMDGTDERPGWPRAFLLLFVGSFAVTYRMLGAILAPVVLWFAVVTRRRDRLVVLPLSVWGVLGLLVLLAGGWDLVGPQLPQSLGHALERAFHRVPLYLRDAVVAHLYPFPGDLANDVYHYLSLSLSALGLLRWTYRDWRTAAWGFTTIYGAALLVVTAESARYLMPLMPVLVLGFLEGMTLVTRLVAERLGWLRASGAGLAGSAVGSIVVMAALIHLLAGPRTGGWLVDLEDTRSLFGMLTASEAASQQRVAFIQPRTLTWATGVPAMVIPRVDTATLLSELQRQGITHVVLEDLELEVGRTRRMERTIREYSCHFDLTYSNDSYRLYSFRDECSETR